VHVAPIHGLATHVLFCHTDQLALIVAAWLGDGARGARNKQAGGSIAAWVDASAILLSTVTILTLLDVPVVASSFHHRSER
jgi:hypothetical protein